MRAESVFLVAQTKIKTLFWRSPPKTVDAAAVLEKRGVEVRLDHVVNLTSSFFIFLGSGLRLS